VKKILLAGLCAFVMVAGMAGCGGGNDGGTGVVDPSVSTVLKGTAATGKAIIGTVTVKDSTGETKQVDLASDGTYEIDLAGMTGPFILQAEGEVAGVRVVVHSVATAEDLGGNINITPITDLIVANLAQDLAEHLFDSFDSGAVSVDAINKSEEEVQAILTNIMADIGLDASMDLMRNSFTADGTGLDALLDLIDIDIEQDDTGAVAVEIINTATDERVQVQIDQVAAVEPLPTTPDMTELQKSLNGIKNSLNVWSALFKTSVPQPDNTELVGIFHDTFIDCGRIRTSFLDEITEDDGLTGVTFDNVVITDSTYVADGEVWCSFDLIISASGEVHDLKWLVLKNGDTWQFAGARDYFELEVIADMVMDSTSGTAQFTSAISVYVGDGENQRAGLALDYVMVDGPGFPAPLKLTLLGGSDRGDEFYNAYQEAELDIDQISTTESSEYIFKFYTAADTEITIPDGHGGFFVNKYVAKKAIPLPVATLQANPEKYFPQFTGPDAATQCGFDGGNLAFTWTEPTDVPTAVIDFLAVSLNRSGGENVYVSDDPEYGDTSMTITIGASGDYTDITGGEARVEYYAKNEDWLIRRVVPFEASCAADEIIGSWGGQSPDGTVVITFLDDSNFVFSQEGTTDFDGHSGIEIGTYMWDPITGDFAATITRVDTNGEWGVSHPSPSNIIVSDNTMSVTYPGEAPSEINRIVRSPGTLVGGWGGQSPDDTVVITFIDGSNFVFSQEGTVDEDGQSGIEVGTYIWDSATGNFAATITRADTNGEWGFSHPSPLVITVSGDTMSVTYPFEEPRAINLIGEK